MMQRYDDRALTQPGTSLRKNGSRWSTDTALRAEKGSALGARSGPGARSLLRIVLLSGLSACASQHTSSSTGADPDGTHPIRIEYVHYTSGQKLELVDQSHATSAEVYSKTRRLEDASTKVSTHEVLQEMLDHFQSLGFFDKAEPGGSPSAGQGIFLQSLEVETPERFVHLTMQKGVSPADVKLFIECQKAFIAIYNNTYQLQSVDRPPDWNSQGQSAKNSAKKPSN